MTAEPVSQERPHGSDGQGDIAPAVTGGIGRLLALAAIYPPGHPRCVEVEDQVLATYRRAEPEAPLRLTVTQQSMSAGDAELPLDEPNIARLHGTLNALAIVSLRIDPGVVAGDLQKLAVRLMSSKAQLQRATGFSRIDITDELPTSIRIEHRAFGSRLVSESVAATVEAARAAVLRRFQAMAPAEDLAAAAGLAGSIVARLIERIDQGQEPAPGDELAGSSIVGRFVERVEHGAIGPADASTRGRALESVLDLCAHAMQQAIEQMLGDGQPLSELAKLVQNVEKAVAVAQDKQGVEALLDVLQLVADEVQAESGAAPAGDREVFALTSAELETELAALVADPRPFAAPDVERQEWLTILLQLALQAPAGQLTLLAATLKAGRDAAWGAAERALLVRGCAAFAGVRELALVDRFLPTLFELVRGLPGRVVLDFLLPLCEALPAATARVWPHVVNELLHEAVRHASEHAGQRERLWSQLAAVAGPAREGCIKRLLRLDFVRSAQLQASILEHADANLREVLADALSWPEGDPLGRQLLQELRAGPPRWPGAEVLLASPSYDGNARQLVQHAMRAGPRAATADELQQLSVRVLAAIVPQLPPERRDEPWIPAALAVLGRVPAEGAPVLAAVLRRRWLLWPEWPAACRRAARAALMNSDAGAGEVR